MNGQQRVFIENIKPQVNGGQFPVKRVIGENFKVTADIYCDGHDVLSAEVLYKYSDEEEWQQTEMEYGEKRQVERRISIVRNQVHITTR